MSITLTANYKEVLSTETVEKIEELLEDNYALDDILEFIDEYNERAFVNIYEEYVRCGEAIGYEAVDALASEDGIDNIEGCDDRYRGCYDSEADFAEDYYNETMNVPDGLVIDWEATYDRNLRYDFTSCDDGTSYACGLDPQEWRRLSP
jgi:antirestriction protein